LAPNSAKVNKFWGIKENIEFTDMLKDIILPQS
jgi:hypothetical protein